MSGGDQKVKNSRAVGVLLVLVSAVIFSSAGLFVKSVNSGSWDIIFWRGLFAALFTAVYVFYKRAHKREFSCMGRPGLAAAVMGALGTMAFIPAFKLTTIANVSLIYAASPFIAAAIMWVWVREKPSQATVFASLVAFGGVFVIVLASIGHMHLKGDLLALWMTIAMSSVLCIYRRYPNTPAAGPAVLMSLFLVPVAFLFTDPFQVPAGEMITLACFGLVFSMASVTLAEGAKRLPAAETALLSALETPLAPLWAWFLFSEVPAGPTFIGGTIVLLAVYGSQMFNRTATD